MSSDVTILRGLAAALGQAVNRDDIARSVIEGALEVPGAIRVGLALNRTGRHLQFLSSDEDRLGDSLRWCLIDAFADVPLNDVVRSGDDIYLPSPEALDASYPEIGPRQRALGTRSMATLALTAGSERLGGLMIAFGEQRDFDVEWRDFLASFAAQVSQALRRESVHDMQLTDAEHLQRSLMPASLPEPPGLSSSAHYQPAGLNSDVGGDWYDLFELSDGSVAFAVGDVMGKGVEAAILMGEIRTALRAYALLDASPSTVMSLLEAFVSSRTGLDQLVTVVYGTIDEARRSVTLSVAGHPPPLLVRPTGAPESLGAGLGPALGFGAGPWGDVTVPLDAHDTLFLYSNGLVDWRGSHPSRGMGEMVERLGELPRRRRRPRELCALARESVVGHDSADDITMLAIGVTGDAVHRAFVQLPSDTTAPGRARQFLGETLPRWGVDEGAVATAQLCVSELVTNAVIHSGTPSELTVEVDDESLTVLVLDRGVESDVQLSAEDDPVRVSGRGLTLVDALTSGWGVQQNPDGTGVWFELELSGSPELDTAVGGV